ncbi:MAG: hypothetical protein AB6733_12770 [Clostridiaceae bacterium]
MDLKRGIVLEVKKKVAYLLTSSGEVVLVKIYDLPPEVGDLYESTEVQPSILYKIHINPKIVSLCVVLVLIITLSIGSILYYIPVTTVSINEYSSMIIKTNRFNKVISTIPKNSLAENILDSADVKGKDLSTALEDIYTTSVNLEILDEDFKTYKKIYSVKITSNKKDLNLQHYIETLKASPYIIQVSKDGYDLLNTIAS